VHTLTALAGASRSGREIPETAFSHWGNASLDSVDYFLRYLDNSLSLRGPQLR
jgi:hypothetical protein